MSENSEKYTVNIENGVSVDCYSVDTTLKFIKGYNEKRFETKDSEAAELLSKPSVQSRRPKNTYHFVNEKRDARIFALRVDKKPFEEVCNIIKKEFNEMIDPQAAQQALKNYCSRTKKPYPYGKRGRKAEI